MRTMHDAILIGIGTALNDNPQLNSTFKSPDSSYINGKSARHLPSRPSNEKRYHLPRPVILDAHLRLHPECKLLINYKSGTGRRPWVICSSSASPLNRATLEKAGARIIEITERDG